MMELVVVLENCEVFYCLLLGVVIDNILDVALFSMVRTTVIEPVFFLEA